MSKRARSLVIPAELRRILFLKVLLAAYPRCKVLVAWGCGRGEMTSRLYGFLWLYQFLNYYFHHWSQKWKRQLFGENSHKTWLIGCFPKALKCTFIYYYCFILFLFLINFYLFLSALGFRCCARAFSSCSERGLLFVAVRGLLIVVASLVVEHGL